MLELNQVSTNTCIYNMYTRLNNDGYFIVLTPIVTAIWASFYSIGLYNYFCEVVAVLSNSHSLDPIVFHSLRSVAN